MAAQAFAWLLRPGRPPRPARVPVSAYFAAEELVRARRFARGQRLIALGSVALDATLLTLLVTRPPRRGFRLAERATGARPLGTNAAVAASLTLITGGAQLPLRAMSRRRAIEVGLATQTWRGWAADAAKGFMISAGFTALGGALFAWVARRFPRRWWLVAAGGVPAVEILLVWLAPVVLAPIFNRFTELPAGEARDDVLSLAERSGVDVGGVFVVDASRRTTGTNAFVTGLVNTKRVVLYDTLIERFTPAQVRLVVAHELAHVKHRDLLRSMLWAALVAPAGMYAVRELSELLARPAKAEAGAPSYLPAIAGALAIVGAGGGVIANQLSRRVEERADAFALELTGEPLQFIAMEQQLALTNVADPDPPRILTWLGASHPSIMERIGAAVAYAEGATAVPRAARGAAARAPSARASG